MKPNSSFKHSFILSLMLLVGVLLISQFGLTYAQDPNNSLDAADGAPRDVVFVDADGRVGVGTKSPSAKLHVLDSTTFVNVSAGGGLQRADQSGLPNFDLPTTIRLEHKAERLPSGGGFSNFLTPTPPPLKATTSGSIGVTAIPKVLFLNAESSDMIISFKTSGVERMRIDPDGSLNFVDKCTFQETPGGNEYCPQLGISTHSIQSFRDNLLLNPQGNNVGIGTSNPKARLTVAGNFIVETDSGIANVDIRSRFSRTDTGAWMSLNDNGKERISMAARNATTNFGGLIDVRNRNGDVTVRIAGDHHNGSGRITTSELEITGGSDLAELFDMADTGSIEPGMVVSIDPDNPGKLRLTNQAYDRTVAGVISGAGDLKPGLILQQQNTIAAGQYPIALTGRVYVWADASNGAVHPGDMLTTADTPGHAMKVTDYERAQGAILGKAMTSLESGSGLVLVLVSLQ